MRFAVGEPRSAVDVVCREGVHACHCGATQNTCSVVKEPRKSTGDTVIVAPADGLENECRQQVEYTAPRSRVASWDKKVSTKNELYLVASQIRLDLALWYGVDVLVSKECPLSLKVINPELHIFSRSLGWLAEDGNAMHCII